MVNYNDGSGTLKTWTVSAANVVSNKDTVIAIDVRRDKLVCYQDGKYVAETAWTMPDLGSALVPNVTLPLTIGGEGNGVHSGFAGYVNCIAVAVEHDPRALSENPWQLFRARRSATFPSLGAPAAATLNGVALSVASASGELTTQIPLTGTAVSITTVAGVLTAQIRIEGAALAEATATGMLAGGDNGLAGQAAIHTAAVATLTTSIRLSGDAAMQAGVSGELTTQIPLTATALAEAIATGMLSVPILLAGAATAEASASGVLSDAPEAAAPVYFRLTACAQRVARLACADARLVQLQAGTRRLTTLTYRVTHA